MNPAVIERCRREIDALRQAIPELEDNETLRSDMIEGETSLDHVAGRLIFEAKQRAAAIEARKGLVAELRQKTEADERAVARIRDGLLRLLEAANLAGFKCPAGTAAIGYRKGGLQFSDDFDASKLPPSMVSAEVTYKPIREAILAALESGEEIQGAFIANGSTILRIC